MSQNDFPERLIKGRIAETVFELMFREATDFDVYPLGYEHTMPILTQYRDHPNEEHRAIINKVLDNVDNTPDFLLTNSDKSEIYLVEVKYRSELNPDKILEIATEIKERWHPAHLFVATPNGFFYNSCKTIIENKGEMTALKDYIVPKDKQDFYLKLLMRFENNKYD